MNFGQIREIELLSMFPIMSHSVHWGIKSNPPQKHHPSFLPSRPLNLHTIQAPPLLGNSPLYIIVFRETPLKTWIFQ